MGPIWAPCSAERFHLYYITCVCLVSVVHREQDEVSFTLHCPFTLHLSVYFPQSTAGEMKFAIQVESVLNQISSPEYRQLMVEATMVLCLMAENLGKDLHWDEPINIGSIVHRANAIFLDEQVQCI